MPMTTVTFKLHTGPSTTGGGAAQASLGIAIVRVALEVPVAIATRLNLIDDRAAMYAAMFAEN